MELADVIKENKTHTRGSTSSSQIIGDGEMAELTRAFDWARTPLGPVEKWSDTLLTTVNLVLASRHPMFLWWGPELVQFYNDGYRPSIREDKHPGALGQRGIECWPEIWPIIGPQIESVMRDGKSSWNINHLVPINRNGKLEEVYWTYSYSPVRDKDGSVRGTLVVCSETTDEVLNHRRLRTLLAIGEESPVVDDIPRDSGSLVHFAQKILEKLDGDSADIPFASIYLYERGDFTHAAGIGLTAKLADPSNWPLAMACGENSSLLMEDLQSRFGDLAAGAWAEPLTRAFVFPLPMPSSSIPAVMVFGTSPRLPFDERYRTFLQLVGTRIAGLLQGHVHQIEIAKAAKRFRSLAAANPFGMVIGSLTGELEYVNPMFLETLGYTEAEVRAGKLRWDLLTPPEYAGADTRALEQLRTRGWCDVYEKAYIARDNRRIPILMGASIVDSPDGEPKVAAFATDLSSLKKAEDALRRANDDLEKRVAERTAELQNEISERKRAELSLREIHGRLLRMQDEERRHLARELHDHAGQTLAALSLTLSAIEVSATKDPGLATLALEGRQLSDDLSREIRTLSYLLHPPLLDEVGLESALRWYVEGFSQRSKVQVELDLPGRQARLPRELELVIFRIVQESLTNVHRHSGSPSVMISIRRAADSMVFEIRDVGEGISSELQVELKTARAGVGVRGMEERVRQFGGTLEIRSNENGTVVAVTLPIPNSGRN
jgi:PAS domain S-box-containing protein